MESKAILKGMIICECLLASFDSRQCIEPCTKYVEFYSKPDKTLLQFLREICFNGDWRCGSDSCRSKKIHKHLWTVWHGNGRLEIRVRKLKQPMKSDLLDAGMRFRVLMWSYCRECASIVTPLVDMSEKASQFSFAKFLEMTFYNEAARSKSIECSHSSFRFHHHFFSLGGFVARFSYESCEQYTVRFGGSLLNTQFNPKRSVALDGLDSTDFWVIEYKALKYISDIVFSAFIVAASNASAYCSSSEASMAAAGIMAVKERINKERELFLGSMDVLWKEMSEVDCSGGWGSYFSLRVNQLKLNLRIMTQEWNLQIQTLSNAAVLEAKTPNSDNGFLTADNTLPSKGFTTPKSTEISPKGIPEAKYEPPLVLTNPQFSFRDFNTQTGDIIETASLPNAESSISKDSAPPPVNPSLLNKVSTQNFKVDLASLVTEANAPIKDSRYSSSWLGTGDGAGHIIQHSILSGCAVVVFEDEPSSIISYTLHSFEYLARIHKMSAEELRNMESSEQRKIFSDVYPQEILTRCDRDKVVGIASDWGTFTDTSLQIPRTAEATLTSPTPQDDDESGPQFDEDALLLDDSEAFTYKFMMSYATVTTFFECKIFFPIQFHSLRQQFLGFDIDFMQSIARCAKWGATGGKSGSTFSKTLDDRYILKYVKRREFKMYIDFAHQYFKYMAKAFFHQCPTLLVKVLGVYQITWKKSNNQKLGSKYVVLMPNLFYQTNLKTVFDLKGSIRNRLVKDEQSVLLDENFILYTKGFPLPLSSKSKELLRMCVHNDTLFLSKQEIVDYSILVGIDDVHKELVVGIIDYLRQYTWDKQIETGVKSLGKIAGQGAPTVISPKSYKRRFRLAMERYFMVIPGRFTQPKPQ
eukprot:TRINITY_DN9293_c0_g1_i2.p1 TRINITY_DN9293_c0_g1~~TRINITY_DN9293_c0_g1_i2.p1  ORF type:complete len:969 (+),score=239.60 TRINITY_DN9293_c0_g1_i2:312-2909(+)